MTQEEIHVISKDLMQRFERETERNSGLATAN